MAILFPDSKKAKVVFVSSAEKHLYDLFRSNLGDDWRVYYSRTLSSRESSSGHKDNEIDFVLYHPSYGLIVIEVKGGRISYDAEKGVYFSINRHDEKFRIKDPFQQALVWKSRFVKYLKNHGLKLPVSHCVGLPSVDEASIPQTTGVNRDMVLGRHHMQDVEGFLKRLATTSHPEKYLDFKDVSKSIDKLLAGQDFHSKLYLRDYMDSQEKRVQDIESIQETFITPVTGSTRLGIEGEAGTGKTMLAIMLAKHFSFEGKSVLFLSSSSLLAGLIKSDLPQQVEVLTYNDLGRAHGVNLLHPGKEYGGKRNDWVQLDAPQLLKNKIESSSKRYDVIICDEGQDVQPFWWECIEGLLKNKENSKFYVFFDRSQGVFGSGGSDNKFTPDNTIPVPTPYFPLAHNYRTTREIAMFSRPFRSSKDVFRSHTGRIGYLPEVITYKDEHDAIVKLEALLSRLVVDESLSPSEIAILSARNPQAKASILRGKDSLAGLPVEVVGSDRRKDLKRTQLVEDGQLAVSTIAGFKGLEMPVVVLTNLSEYDMPLSNPIMQSLTYVALTRAKHMLFVMVKEGDQKQKYFKSSLAEVESQGSMIISDTQSGFEFSGTVTHYNPERMGLLKVSDPGFKTGQIMFFPSDIAASGISLESLKVGVKLKFRPRVEGYITVATDLQLA